MGSPGMKGEGKMQAKKAGLLRSRDVAHVLDYSPDDVIELAREEKLKGLKQGRFWKFRFQDVESYRRRMATLIL
jgi:hypothetical protein